MQTVASSAQIVKFNFNLDSLQAVRDGDSVWFPLRPICDAIGLDTDSQRVKLKAQPWSTTVMRTVVAADGKARELFCIDRRTVPMWLATIDSSRVADHVRPKLEAYQCGIADLLDRTFFPSTQPKGLAYREARAALDARKAAHAAEMAAIKQAERLLEGQPAARQIPPRDDWQPRLEAYLADVPPAFQPTVGGILYDLGIQHVTRADQMRVARSLQSLGYARFLASGPKRCWKYRRAA